MSDQDHTADDHNVSGEPEERMRRVLARHLCGWIAGHGAPLDHFLYDSDVIMADAHAAGIAFTEQVMDAGAAQRPTKMGRE